MALTFNNGIQQSGPTYGQGIADFNDLTERIRQQRIAQLAQQGQLVAQGTEESGKALGQGLKDIASAYTGAKSSAEKSDQDQQKIDTDKSRAMSEEKRNESLNDLTGKQSEEIGLKNSVFDETNALDQRYKQAQIDELNAKSKSSGNGEQDWKPTDYTDANGNPVTLNSKTGQTKALEGLKGKPKDASESEKNYALAASQMNEASDKLSKLEATKGYDPRDMANVVGKTPVVGPVVNYFKGVNDKEYDNAKDAFLNARLQVDRSRGNQTSKKEDYESQYFGVPGEPDSMVANKAQMRKQFIESIKSLAGPATITPATGTYMPQPTFQKNALSGTATAGPQADTEQRVGADGQVYTYKRNPKTGKME